MNPHKLCREVVALSGSKKGSFSRCCQADCCLWVLTSHHTNHRDLLGLHHREAVAHVLGQNAPEIIQLYLTTYAAWLFKNIF